MFTPSVFSARRWRSVSIPSASRLIAKPSAMEAVADRTLSMLLVPTLGLKSSPVDELDDYLQPEPESSPDDYLAGGAA